MEFYESSRGQTLLPPSPTDNLLETVNWIKFGDKGTKFFHANATVRSRKNHITVLQDDNGTSHCDHSTKENILWEPFKDRLGKSDNPTMHFDLDSLLTTSTNLGCLDEEFTSTEIDQVVRHLPTDKSPGPDGFNTDFVKKMLAHYKARFLQSLQCISKR